MDSFENDLQVAKVITPEVEKQIFEIWNAEFPAPATFETIEKFQSHLAKAKDPIHYYIKIQNKVTGWLMTFNRDSERFFVLLVPSHAQGKGLGRCLIKQVQLRENTLWGNIVIDDSYRRLKGGPYLSPVEFYRKLGFSITQQSETTNSLTTFRIKWSVAPKS